MGDGVARLTQVVHTLGKRMATGGRALGAGLGEVGGGWGMARWRQGRASAEVGGRGVYHSGAVGEASWVCGA